MARRLASEGPMTVSDRDRLAALVAQAKEWQQTSRQAAKEAKRAKDTYQHAARLAEVATMGVFIYELERLLTAEAVPVEAEQLVAGILAEYRDELTKEASDRCEQCGPMVMCSFHSVLSLLTGDTTLRVRGGAGR